MMSCKTIRETTMHILEKRGFEVVNSDESHVLFAGFGATGKVGFAIKANETHLKFYFTKDYTINFQDDWHDEKICFMMTNHFSKVREGLFKIYYEPPGKYECISCFTSAALNETLYKDFLDYLLCIAIEGYAVLNCEKFYKKATVRNSLCNTYERNIATLGPWKSPGFCVNRYA